MVVLPGSAVALGRYEVTVGEYREFASATSGGVAEWTSPCPVDDCGRRYASIGLRVARALE